MSQTGRAAVNGQAGFTLFELIVVLALGAAIAGLAMQAGVGGGSSAGLQAIAYDAAAMLRQARAAAIGQQRFSHVQFDADSRTIQMSDPDRDTRAPKDVSLKLILVPGQGRDPRSGGIGFFPNGSSTGGAVTFSRAGKNYQVRVNWLSGQVSVVAGE